MNRLVLAELAASSIDTRAIGEALGGEQFGGPVRCPTLPIVRYDVVLSYEHVLTGRQAVLEYLLGAGRYRHGCVGIEPVSRIVIVIVVAPHAPVGEDGADSDACR